MTTVVPDELARSAFADYLDRWWSSKALRQLTKGVEFVIGHASWPRRRGKLSFVCSSAVMLLVGLLIVGPALAQPGATFCRDGDSAPLRGMQKAVQSAMDDGMRTLQQQVTASGSPVVVPGGVISIVLPSGECLSAAFGLADKERHIPMSIEHRFAAGSSTKTMIAALIIGEQLKGTLRLDDPISKYLGTEWWFNYLVNGNRITIRELLQHTAGLPDLQWDLLARSPDFKGTFLPGETDFAKVLGKSGYFLLPATHEPGSAYGYSDAHYVLLAFILERINKERFEEQVHQMLYRLRMMFSEPDAMSTLSGVAQGYIGYPSDYGQPEMGTTSTTDGVFKLLNWLNHGGGWLVSSPRDLARWAWIYFGGHLYASDYVRTLTDEVGSFPISSPAADPRATERMGAGVFITAKSALGRRLCHYGYDWGYDTFMAYYPDVGIAVAFQTNTNLPRIDFNPAEQVALKISRILKH